MTKTNQFNFNEAIEKLDKSDSIGSIEQIGDQVQHIWELAQNLQFDKSYQDINKVVVAGMGGSIIGTHVIQTVFKEDLELPIITFSDYDLPRFVDDKTLFVASSYSGNTEETLSAVQDAVEQGAKITGITSGGKLAEFFQNNKYPAIIFDPKHNPSGSPRMALGYSIFGQIALFSKANLLPMTQRDYSEVLEIIAQTQLDFIKNVKKETNPAKLLAYSFLQRIPVITVAEHLEGMAHVFVNQLNENAKTYSNYRVIPEINHHLLEGLQLPSSNESNLFFLTIQSDLYQEENQKRLQLTEEVIDKNQIEYLQHKLKSSTQLTQAFELLMLSSYTSFYLAMLNNLDPNLIPWVDWFKEELKKN